MALDAALGPPVEPMKGHVLVIDDDQESCDALEAALVRHGLKVTTSTNALKAVDQVRAEEFDLVLTDLSMPDLSGLELCERVREARPSVPIIVVTGQGSLHNAIGAIQRGAYDFLTKPVDTRLLFLSVARALQHRSLQEQVERLRASGASDEETSPIVGNSPAMGRVHDLIARVSESDASVLLHGETGTGKELVARAIHTRSRRKAGPFVAINCAAVPPSLIESELFGHTRGAFTDAKAERRGLFVEANGGTLFLDEIGELPLDMQPKLLRALQERKVRPVGSNTELSFDCRLVAATNRNLEEEVREKRFREDLYYRINVVKVDVPPLRERGDDAIHLAHYFLKQFAGRTGKPGLQLSMVGAEKLMAYGWPGNVRELENCIERAVALARFEQVTVEDLPEKVRAYRSKSLVVAANDPTEIVTMAELERRYVLRVLTLVGGNKTRAAEVLGFDRRTLYRKLGRYDGHATEKGVGSEPPPPSHAPGLARSHPLAGASEDTMTLDAKELRC